MFLFLRLNRATQTTAQTSKQIFKAFQTNSAATNLTKKNSFVTSSVNFSIYNKMALPNVVFVLGGPGSGKGL